MVLYVYFTENQQHEGEQFREAFPKAIVLERFQKLDSLSKSSVLVLLSQPSEVFAEEIRKFSFRKVVVHAGIRYKGKNAIYAGHVEEIVKLVKKEFDAYKKHNQDAYQKHIQKQLSLSEEETKYLQDITGNKRAKKNNGFKWFKEKEPPRPSLTGIFTLMGSGKSVADFARIMAKESVHKILLIDGNLLNPSMDVHFGINHLETSIKSHLRGVDNTGFNIAMDAVSKKISFHEMLPQMVKKINNKLDLLLGNYNLYNYEHYDLKVQRKLMETIKEHYSVVLIHVSDMPYDEFALLSYHLSRVNIIICEDSSVSLRYGYNVMEILQAKQQIPAHKFLTVLDAGGKKLPQVGGGVMKEIFEKSYLGAVYGNDRKRAKRLRQIQKSVMERQELWA